MTGPITQFIRQVLGLAYRKKALQGMRHPDPTAGMPRSMRGRRF
jgi:hypothetical protein